MNLLLSPQARPPLMCAACLPHPCPATAIRPIKPRTRPLMPNRRQATRLPSPQGSHPLSLLRESLPLIRIELTANKCDQRKVNLSVHECPSQRTFVLVTHVFLGKLSSVIPKIYWLQRLVDVLTPCRLARFWMYFRGTALSLVIMYMRRTSSLTRI
jgi:hypothetical protein